MADETTIPGAPPEPGDESLKSFWWRIQGIFFEPKATFQEIRRKPNWLIPVILLVIISIGAQYYVINSVGFENIMRQQMMQSSSIQQLSQEQREEIISQQLESPIVRNLAYLGPLFLVIILLILAGVFLLGLMLIGSESTFSRVFSVLCHSMLAYSVITTILLVLVVFLAADKQEIDLTNPIQSNLGMLVDAQESPVMFRLASSIDLLSFYFLWLLAVGLSVVGRKSLGSTLTLVGALWAVYVGGKMGWAALFG